MRWSRTSLRSLVCVSVARRQRARAKRGNELMLDKSLKKAQQTARGLYGRVILKTLSVVAALIWTSSAGLATVVAQANDLPSPPVIFLHYDYMVGTDGHSHEPSEEAIQMVREAFSKQRISLVIDPIHLAIPEHKTIVFGQTGPVCSNVPDPVLFRDLKTAYFSSPRQIPWHYAIFGHYLALAQSCDLGPFFSGSADLPGFDFAVALGLSAELIGHTLPIWEADVLMHELGHNLNLQHGGGDPVDYKPNYLSVMNDAFVFTGILQGESPGSTTIVGRRADYSGQKLDTLNEFHLDERIGINSGTNDITLFSDDFIVHRGAGTGPIDWNFDGVIDADVAININRSSNESFPRLEERVDGYNDWEHIRAWLNLPAYKSVQLRSGPAVP